MRRRQMMASQTQSMGLGDVLWGRMGDSGVLPMCGFHQEEEEGEEEEEVVMVVVVQWSVL